MGESTATIRVRDGRRTAPRFVLVAIVPSLFLLCQLSIMSAPAGGAILQASDVEAGFFRSCAIRLSGQVACWGKSFDYGLGDGTTVDRITPSAVVGLNDATAISVGDTHSCAIRRTGQAVCWGFNPHGQLGDGTTTSRLTPTPVVGLTDVVAISADSYRTCAIVSGGQAYCWGENVNGQLGDGTKEESRLTPTPVSGLSDAVAISAGWTRTCAVRSNGQALCWGEQDGTDLSYEEGLTPSPVSGLSDAIDIDADEGHICAIRVTLQTACWGNYSAGEVGNGEQNVFCCIKSPVNVLSDTAALSTGGLDTCAVRTSGMAMCWGRNEFGQLGLGAASEIPTSSPAPVAGLSNAIDISAGMLHTCGLNSLREVLCWGYNEDGQLGTGLDAKGRWQHLAVPTPVLDDTGLGVPAPPPPRYKRTKKKGALVGIVCGSARFDLHPINADLDSDSIQEGDRACMLALSNDVTRELGGAAAFTSALILSRFGTLIREELGDRAAKKEASRLRKKLTLKNVLKALGPIGKTISRANAVVNVGKGVSLALLVYAASVHYKQVARYQACTRILLSQDGGRLNLGGGVLYSPMGINNPRRDRHLTEASVWEQERKRFRPDEWTRRSSGLRCNASGRIEVGRNEIFNSPSVAAVNPPVLEVVGSPGF